MNIKNLEKVRVPKQKTIALIAHDGMKAELFKWVGENIDLLKKHKLCGTGTTSTMIREKYSLEIQSFFSGPLGGDQQVGGEISKGNIDYLIFFWDPLEAQPHDPDVKALLRIAVLYDVPVAMSPTSASLLMKSEYTNKEFDKYVINPNKNIDMRVKLLDE
mgnify:CR=1 FL=1